MIDETVWVREHGMEETSESQLILSFRYIGSASAKLIVGSFGYENIHEDLYVGDFVKYANSAGLFEVRLTKIGEGLSRAQLRIRQLAGPLGAPEKLEGAEAENAPFTAEETKYIQQSVSEVKTHLLGTALFSEAQRLFIENQFAHMGSAAARMGRKDWVVLAIGTLTNIIIGAALNPESARALFSVAQRLLGWAFGGIHLLPE